MHARDLAALRVPSDPTLAPDGRLAVVTLTRIDLEEDEYRSQLWLVPLDRSASPRPLTHGKDDASPAWSPDGRWIAFLRSPQDGKPQIHVLPADGGEARRVTDHPLGAGPPRWSPDSTRVAYVARVPEPGRYGTEEGRGPEREAPRRITTRQYRLDDLGFTIDRRPHVFVIDVLRDDAQPCQITAGDFEHADPAWSPDGSQVAFVSSRHERRDEDYVADVFVAPAGGGDARRVTRTDLVAAAPAWTPDGETILFVAPGGTDLTGRTSGLWRVPVDGSQPPHRLTDPEELDAEGPTVRVLVDRRGALTSSVTRGAVHLVRVPLDGGERQLVLGGERQVTGFDVRGDVVVAVVADACSVGEVVAVGDGGERTASDFGAELARTTSLRPLRQLEATAPDGTPVHGWIVVPAGTGPFPVLLNIHGGPFSQYGYTLLDEAQVHAGAGYAVVLGNPRGSQGYGEAHGRSIVGALGTVDADDLLALLDAALEDPDLDAHRVGVMGGSYGGFMAAWLAAHAGARFRAAVVERAVTAWDSFTGTSDIGWFFTQALCGPDPERQRAQSALTYADQIRIPTLIIHSEQDWRCPVEQAQRLFERLKRNGVETELLLFPGEGHELSRSGLPSHRVARFEAMLEWWSRHLGASEA